MTTIVYRDGIVAADSQLSTGGDWSSPWPAKKLERHGDDILGLCGDWAAVRVLKAWVLGGFEGDQPTVGNCTLVQITPDQLICYSQGAMILEPGEFLSWGSGAPVAMAAMLAGASAKEAVRIACQLDPWSSGPVTWMRRPTLSTGKTSVKTSTK